MSHMKCLTAEEHSQLALIVANAHRERWIDPGCTLAAEHSSQDDSIVVTVTQGNRVVQKNYEQGSRWPFQLLRDLAWGDYA
jgi:hypothetical protein